jgi:hypothetical protein
MAGMRAAQDLRRLGASLLLAAVTSATPLRAVAVRCQQAPEPGLAVALRQYFAAANPAGPERDRVLQLARGREPELLAALRQKSFLPPPAPVARRGRIAAGGAFVDDATADNPALLYGSDQPGLLPLLVYVPDVIDTLPHREELERFVAAEAAFVLVVPDERRDNRYLSTPAELDRHTGGLRDLLLQYPIDPNRVFMVGSGRGGHATWDVGLVRSGRFAGIYPCNGGLIHEGGFGRSGGVFVENGKDLAIFTVYNTSFDHGIEGCRYASRLLQQWGTRFISVEEPRMRLMPLAEAWQSLAPLRRNAHPRSLTKVWNRLPDGNHYWLEALERRPKAWEPEDRIAIRGELPTEPELRRQRVWQEVLAQSARLHGQVAGNQIRIEARGTGRLRVWLDPELVDYAAKVTVVVNGKAQPPVLPKQRLERLLARVHATGDTAQLYGDAVEVVVPR